MLSVYIYTILSLIVTFVSAWAVVTIHMPPGFITKLTLGLLSLSTFANAGWVWIYNIPPTETEMALIISIAALSVRCYWIRCIKRNVRKFTRNRCD